MSSSLVSVIIPSFNHEAFVGNAVESVLRQTHTELELIIVDDGSSDRSCRYFRRLKDIRVRLFENENMGAHAAINFGLAQANGNWLAILNSDDIYHVNRIETVLDRLRSQRCHFGASWIELIDGRDRVIGVKRGWETHLPSWAPPAAESSDFVENLQVTNFISTTSNMLFSREVYEQVGGMRNLRFVHDWDFSLRVAERFSCLLVPQPLVKYRIHSANTIRTDQAAMMYEIRWLRACHLKGSKQSGGSRDDLSPDATAVAAIAGHIERRKQMGEADPEIKALFDNDLHREVERILEPVDDTSGPGSLHRSVLGVQPPSR